MRWAATATKSAWEEDSARPVPVPWEKLNSVIKPKGGNIGIVMSAPGVGKTTLLLNWAVHSNMKTLFISSDTSPHDITAQLGALATGHERRLVEQRLMGGHTWRQEYSRAIYDKYPNIVLDFAPRPSMADIRAKAIALTELWGEAPEMIVMDTASNVMMKEMDSNAEWQRVWLQSREIARSLNAFFMFAHHVKQGPARSGRVAPDLNDGLWGCDQFPEFVLGLHAERTDQMTLTVRKNRGGKKDVPVRLDADLARAKVSDPDG